MKIQDFVEKYDWTMDSNIPSNLNTYIVIFVPTWSDKDFDIIMSIAGNIEKYKMPVYIYDIDSFLTITEITTKFPQITEVIAETPVIAKISNGQLQNFIQGEEVINFL